MSVITSVEELNALYGGVSEASVAKVTKTLTAEYRLMIEASPFCALATVGPEGLDCSPRGDDDIARRRFLSLIVGRRGRFRSGRLLLRFCIRLFGSLRPSRRGNGKSGNTRKQQASKAVGANHLQSPLPRGGKMLRPVQPWVILKHEPAFNFH